MNDESMQPPGVRHWTGQRRHSAAVRAGETERSASSWDAERALPDARRDVHRTENGCRSGVVAQGALAARALLNPGQGRAARGTSSDPARS